MVKPRVKPLPKTGDGNTYLVELHGRVRYARAHWVDVLRLGQVRADWYYIYTAIRHLITAHEASKEAR